jgi:hypothetical protein
MDTNEYTYAPDQPLNKIESKNRIDVKEQDNRMEIQKESDFITNMMMPENLHSSTGANHNILFNPDTRAMSRYLTYEVTRSLPLISGVKNKDRASVLNMIGYNLYAVYGFILGTDYTRLKPMSSSAASFMNDETRVQLYKQILRMKIPDFTYSLLTKLAQVRDPSKINVVTTPSYHLYDHNLDYGRVIHPNIYFKAHDILITNRATTDKDKILDDIYGSKIYDGTTINNIVGYGMENTTKGFYHTPNWINTAYENLVDPNSQKTLQLGQISGKTKIRQIPITVTNPYQILLSADENLDNTSQLIDRINEIYEELGATKTVLDALTDASGNILLGYCTQHFQLPTWNDSTIKHGTADFKNLHAQAKEFFLLETEKPAITTRTAGVLINDDTTNETAYPIAKPKDVINSPTRYIRFYDFSEQ